MDRLSREMSWWTVLWEHGHANKSSGTRPGRPEWRIPKILGDGIEIKWLWCSLHDIEGYSIFISASCFPIIRQAYLLIESGEHSITEPHVSPNQLGRWIDGR